MLKIYLARHGQDQDNANGILNGHRDEPLTEVGISQAKELADKTKEAGIIFDAIYTSPLKRAVDTAHIVAISQGKTEIVLDSLIERNFGIMTGQPHTKVLEMCAPEVLFEGHFYYFLSPKGAETFPELVIRGKQIIEFVKARHKDRNVLLVSHGDIGKMIYASFYKLDWKKVLLMFHFGNSDLVLLSDESSPSDVHVFKIKQNNGL